MFLNKSSPSHHSDDSDVPIFMRRKRKKQKQKRADLYPFKAFQRLQNGVICTHKMC